MEGFQAQDQFLEDIERLINGQKQPPHNILDQGSEPCQSQERIEVSSKSLRGSKKHKTIQKQKEPKPHSGSKNRQGSKVMGRPNNHKVQEEHLRESRSMNDVIYHYVYCIALLKLKQGSQTNIDYLSVSEAEELWMDKAKAMMDSQTFPDLKNPEPTFLTHSNSLHFLFEQYSCLQSRKSYSAIELRSMFLAFLKKREMLTTTIYNYLVDYWQDIICLAREEEDEVIVIKEGHKDQEMSIQSKRMKKEIEIDQSFAAYQIACYIHACSKRYKFQIIATS